MQRSLFPEADFTAYRSAQDASVNWDRAADVGRIEARYVRRCGDYVVVYLSSQTGCAQGCRMCHLTATGQTRLRDVTVGEMIEQARTVLDHYPREAPPASSVHFNLLARPPPGPQRPLHLHGARRAAGQPGPAGGRRWPPWRVIPAGRRPGSAA